MGNASSKAKTNPVITTQDEAVLKMKIQRDNLEKYRKRIGTVLNRELEIARECLAKGDRKRAALALRKKKYQEQLLDQTDQHLDKLQDLVCLTSNDCAEMILTILPDSKCGIRTSTEGCPSRIGTGQQGVEGNQQGDDYRKS
jgi:hypothetical protein